LANQDQSRFGPILQKVGPKRLWSAHAKAEAVWRFLPWFLLARQRERAYALFPFSACFRENRPKTGTLKVKKATKSSGNRTSLKAQYRAAGVQALL